MAINGWVYKTFRCPKGGLKVHLGPGQKKYIQGWLNVDANPLTAKTDLWANFTHRLPFKDDSVDLIYSHHVIEHLPDLQKHFNEMYRVLRRGGTIRVGGPHMGNACRKYMEADLEWFSDFPEPRESLGGRFTNFIFCAGEHLTAFDETYLTEVASKAGFSGITFAVPGHTSSGADLGVVLDTESEDNLEVPHTIIMEAVKL